MKSTGAPVGLDLHGAVGIELVNPSTADEAVVRRQLGPLPSLNRPPDITIEFVDRLEKAGPVTFVGLDDAGFDREQFLILRSRHKARARVSLPLDTVGGTVRIVCERGLPAVPLLVPVVNLTALARGVVALHAAAFVHEGIGVLVTGWAKGGKTETLLAFMAQGASYVGDEWIYLTADGRMHGMPEPIKVWNWHLAELAEYRSSIRATDQVRLRMLDGLAGLTGWLATRPALRASAPGRLMGRVGPFARNQAYVHLPPRSLFGEDRCRSEASIDRVIFMTSTEASGTTVDALEGRELAERMAASNVHERLDFTAAWLKHRFAFPERLNDFLSRVDEIERDALHQIFDERSALIVRHPYPVSIPSLYDVLWPILRDPHDAAADRS